METLSGAARKYLRGLAHSLKPVVQVGHEGLSENIIKAINDALDAHELIKIKFVAHQDDRTDLSAEIATQTHSNVCGTIGHITILYRQHEDPEKRKIEIPR